MRVTARVALVAVLLLAAACSDAPEADIVLVSRTPHDVSPLQCDDGVSWAVSPVVERAAAMTLALELSDGASCEATVSDVTFRVQGGETAVSSGFATIDGDELVVIGDVAECGVESSASERSGRVAVSGEVISLRFSSGAGAELSPLVRSFIESQCFGEHGTWVGTSGELDGRSGDYEWIENPLQIELTLTQP